MNGMFVAVKNGYQAMMIAPTTLLSAQHFKSFKERFYEHGIRIGKLDRFSTTKERNATLRGLEEGTIDVVVAREKSPHWMFIYLLIEQIFY